MLTPQRHICPHTVLPRLRAHCRKKRQKDYKSQRWWMTMFSRFNRVGEHMNSVCGSMHKTFECWSQTKFQHREERWGWSLTTNQRVLSNWWLLGDRNSVLVVWPIAGQPHSSGWPYIQKYMGSINCIWWILFFIIEC